MRERFGGTMELKIFQKGFNYSQDGAGNRLVYHLLGCNMHCPWCANPEGMSFEYEHKTVSVSDIVSEALRAKAMFFDGGGVTFTGGEATCQLEALLEALKCLKENGINTAIETNGTSKRLPELFPYIDHLIIDLKHSDTVKHRTVTGVGNETVKENIAEAVRDCADVLVRVPLIGGFNNGEDDVQGFLDFFDGIKAESLRVEILKYHEYGKDKWRKLGLDYKMENAFVSEEERRSLEERLNYIGIKTVRT